MSVSVAAQIADEVVTLINAASTANAFAPLTFTAKRRWAVLNSKEQLATLTVSVVPEPPKSQPASRSYWQHDYIIDIGVQQAIPAASTDDPAFVDPLALLLDSILGYCQGDDSTGKSRRVLPTTQAGLISHEYKALADPDMLRQEGVYTGVVALTYRLIFEFR